MPTTVFAAMLVATVVVGLVLPSRILDHWVVTLVAAAAIVAGVVLNLWSDRQLKEARTTVKPDERPTALVATGAYRLTRNPMYVGMAAILGGVALVLGSLPAMVFALAYCLAIQRWFVRREEASMAAAFGAAYEEYRRAVRRWV